VNRPQGPATVRVGARAEEAARRFLEARGLVVLACNYRCRMGELDLVLLDEAAVVVAEVRYRARPDPVAPAASVTFRKRRRLARAAAHFLQRHARFRDHAVRFDVLALTGPLDDPRCEWLRGAFTLDDAARG
jgi:putative endonuclease